MSFLLIFVIFYTFIPPFFRQNLYTKTGGKGFWDGYKDGLFCFLSFLKFTS